eukprot:4131818-Heterocapsa_arctica.AAC.1
MRRGEFEGGEVAVRIWIQMVIVNLWDLYYDDDDDDDEEEDITLRMFNSWESCVYHLLITVEHCWSTC